jgi:glutathione S-transferase
MAGTLFYSPDSANLVVRIALEEIGVAYEALEVDRRHSAQRVIPRISTDPKSRTVMQPWPNAASG